MRLIDADALKPDYYDEYTFDDDEYVVRYYSEHQIDSAPSIDIDRPQGEWKPKNHHTDYCSICGFEETQWRTADYNFCPYCGARMKGVDDE